MLDSFHVTAKPKMVRLVVMGLLWLIQNPAIFALPQAQPKTSHSAVGSASLLKSIQSETAIKVGKALKDRERAHKSKHAILDTIRTNRDAKLKAGRQHHHSQFPPDTQHNRDNATVHLEFPFERVFVINLDRSVARWDHMSELLHQLGWPLHRVERFRATDGVSIFGSNENSSHTAPMSPTMLSPAERGHFLTYLGILEHIVETGIARDRPVLVLEDDVLVEGNASVDAFRSYIQQVNAVDPQWDILWLAEFSMPCMSVRWFPVLAEGLNGASVPLSCAHEPTGAPNIVRPGPSLGTWGAIYSHAGATKVRDFLRIGQIAMTDMQIARMNRVFSRSYHDLCGNATFAIPALNMYLIEPMVLNVPTIYQFAVDSTMSLVDRLAALVHTNPACNYHAL
eukprot:c17828_g1_i1.p1 GENE.c17828_g1_i1~~c17828_g1_i1.p1  ORF type:complete len:396 (+),score=85.70 c17828_g1_i1:957-2144(+)